MIIMIEDSFLAEVFKIYINGSQLAKMKKIHSYHVTAIKFLG